MRIDIKTEKIYLAIEAKSFNISILLGLFQKYENQQHYTQTPGAKKNPPVNNSHRKMEQRIIFS